MKFQSSKAIFIQLAERICDGILQKRFAPGEKLPAIREYAMEVEVNPNTLVRTYNHLQDQGIITMKRGIGYFVNEEATALIIKNRSQFFYQNILPEVFRQMKQLDISIENLTQHYHNDQINKKGKKHENQQ